MPYHGLTITIANANTNYNLLQLVRAVRPEAPALAREVIITASPENSADILIGDETLSATNYGVRLAPGDALVHRTVQPSVPLGGIWLRSSASNQKVSITIIEA